MSTNLRKVILLENPLPMPQKKSVTLSRGKCTTITKKNSFEAVDVDWQIKWMNILNSSREEMNTLLSVERSESLKKTQEIEMLNQKLKVQKCVINELKIAHAKELKSIQNDKRNKETQAKRTVGSATQTDMCMWNNKTQSTPTNTIFVDSFSQTDNQTAEKSIQTGEPTYN